MVVGAFIAAEFPAVPTSKAAVEEGRVAEAAGSNVAPAYRVQGSNLNGV
jgi:hypothetical protein